jgi:hypothetical protein
MGFFSNVKNNFDYDFQDNFKSPLLQEISDPLDLRMTYNRFPIVPFFGNNSDSSDIILTLLYKLVETTPTALSCINSIMQFSTGAGFDLSKSKGLINKQYDTVSDSEIIDFETNLDDVLHDTDLLNLTQFGVKSLQIDGNFFAKVIVSKVANKFTIEPIDTNKIRLTTDKKSCIISNSFNSTDLISFEPQRLPMHPNFIEENGLVQTVIHVKNPMPNRAYYGLSNSASSILEQYQLSQLKYYLSAETDNRFTGRVFFDTEMSLKDSTYDLSDASKNFNKSIENVFTNKTGLRKSVMSRFRENGVTPTNVTQFNAQTGEQFYQVINDIMNQAILMSFGWDGRLIGGASSASMAANEMPTIFKMASQKFKTTQKKLNNVVNTSIDFASKILGYDWHKGMNLELGNLYEQSLKEDITI